MEKIQLQKQSIAEAVAAARAQDAKLQEEKWLREKDKLIQEAEKAALARVESDLAIKKRQLAFEVWQRQLEQEKQGNHVVKQSEDHVGPHPILGKPLADLGHKRVHLVSAQALSSIPVWEKQRTYRHGRANAMAADKLKSLELGMPGIIGIYEVSFLFVNKLQKLNAFHPLTRFRPPMEACRSWMDSIVLGC